MRNASTDVRLDEQHPQARASSTTSPSTTRPALATCRARGADIADPRRHPPRRHAPGRPAPGRPPRPAARQRRLLRLDPQAQQLLANDWGIAAETVRSRPGTSCPVRHWPPRSGTAHPTEQPRVPVRDPQARQRPRPVVAASDYRRPCSSISPWVRSASTPLGARVRFRRHRADDRRFFRSTPSLSSSRPLAALAEKARSQGQRPEAMTTTASPTPPPSRVKQEAATPELRRSISLAGRRNLTWRV